MTLNSVDWTTTMAIRWLTAPRRRARGSCRGRGRISTRWRNVGRDETDGRVDDRSAAPFAKASRARSEHHEHRLAGRDTGKSTLSPPPPQPRSSCPSSRRTAGRGRDAAGTEGESSHVAEVAPRRARRQARAGGRRLGDRAEAASPGRARPSRPRSLNGGALSSALPPPAASAPVGGSDAGHHLTSCARLAQPPAQATAAVVAAGLPTGERASSRDARGDGVLAVRERRTPA